MTKSQLIEEVALQNNLPKTLAAKVVNAMFEEMGIALTSGERIEFRGFGSFYVREYKKYTARNPRTGEGVQVPYRKRIRFRMSELMLKKLNDSFLS